jgi:probable rRNA maturation factor
MSDDPDPCSSSDIPRISIAVTVLDPDWPRAVPAVEDLAHRAAAAAVAVTGAAARALAARDAEISLVLADDATLRRYNRDYRGIDKPTNVLAFAAAAVAITGAAARALAARDAEISLVLADDATLRRYNRDYRGTDKPTNVLAFAAAEAARGPGAPEEAEGPLLLGDVLLARETLVREAGKQGKRPADHLCHLVVHGVLHLLGHDHQSQDEAQIMERLEVAALGRLGVADPYAAAETVPGMSRLCG